MSSVVETSLKMTVNVNIYIIPLKYDDMKDFVTSDDSGQEYAELLCDFMFKRLFGSEENKDVLIAFLNVMLEDVDIVDVFFIPTEHLGETEDDRKAVFDISCKCSDGRTFIIEMQKGHQKHFRDRALFYTSYPINEQGRIARGKHDQMNEERMEIGLPKLDFKWDFGLKPVIVVAILNFSFEHGDGWPDERYHSSYRLREDLSNDVMTESLRFVFMELGRFKKGLDELQTRHDKWMYAFCHIHELRQRPDVFHEKEFRRLFSLSKIIKFTPEEYKQYLLSLKHMSDYLNTIETSHDKGLAEGMKKGREEGRKEGLNEAVKKMLAAGLPAEQIASIMMIPVEQIEALK